MKIAECMSRQVEVCSPDDSLQGVAQKMRQLDTGVMPIGENDRLVGMITDRDIAVRAVADGKGPDTPVREAMTQEVLYCYDDDQLDNVIENMADQKIRRLPVVNRDKRLVGIVSIGDTSQADGSTTSSALRQISTPGGLHSQH